MINGKRHIFIFFDMIFTFEKFIFPNRKANQILKTRPTRRNNSGTGISNNVLPIKSIIGAIRIGSKL